MKLVETNFHENKLAEKSDAEGIGQAFLSLKGCIYKMDNALSVNQATSILRRRKELYEAVLSYEFETKFNKVTSSYHAKLSSLGNELLIVAHTLLQISSLNLLSSVVHIKGILKHDR